MKVGKICSVGNSSGVIVPRQYLHQLGWFKGDQVGIEVLANTLVLHNVTERLTRPITNRKEYGDARANGTGRIRFLPADSDRAD